MDLDPADRTMLGYAEKLTLEPEAMSETDVEALREVGFGDAAILDICQVTAYYNFVNRLAEGLGIELEPYWGSEGERGHEAFRAREDEGPGN